MENDKITEGIKQMAEMFKNAQTERKAFVFMPDIEGFKVYELSEESAKLALTAQALKDKAQAESSNEDSGLGLQHVSGSACPDFDYVQMLKPTYRSNTGEIKKCITFNDSKWNGWFAPASDLP